jgi:phage portal protein BeeE
MRRRIVWQIIKNLSEELAISSFSLEEEAKRGKYGTNKGEKILKRRPLANQ